MFIDFEEYLEYLVKHKITPNQFMFLYLRYFRDTDMLKKYITGVKAWKKEEIDDLVDRGFLDDVNYGGQDYSHGYFVTPKFHDEFFIELELAGEELWQEYPPFIYIDGKKCPARTGDKEELEKVYAKRIKYSRKKHERIIDLVRKLKAQGNLNMGLEKFIKQEMWTSYWDEEKTGSSGKERKADTSEEV